MTLRQLMMLRRLDTACARLNTGLSAIALGLALVTAAMATVRMADAVADTAGVSSLIDPLVQFGRAEARLVDQLW